MAHSYFKFHILLKYAYFVVHRLIFPPQPFKQTANDNEINYIGLASVFLVNEDGHSPLALGATI